MKNDTARALSLVRQKGLTCAVCGAGACYESTARGVAPLLNWLDDGMRFRHFCAADKVVGAGAAYLYVLLEVDEVYADVISKSAQKILQRYGISLYFDTLVPHIQNRTGEGFCPIETAVADASDPRDALTRIRARLRELKK